MNSLLDSTILVFHALSCLETGSQGPVLSLVDGMRNLKNLSRLGLSLTSLTNR